MAEKPRFTDPEERPFQRFWKDRTITVSELLAEIREQAARADEAQEAEEARVTQTDLGRTGVKGVQSSEQAD